MIKSVLGFFAKYGGLMLFLLIKINELTEFLITVMILIAEYRKKVICEVE